MNKKRLPDFKWSILGLAILLMIASFLIYFNFFDILIPGLQVGDSYKETVGSLINIPIILLILCQVFLSGFLFHLVSKSYQNEIRIKTKKMISFLLGSLATFLFSITYALFPNYGPFYYIIFVYNNAPWYSIPLEITWTTLAVVILTILSRRLLNIKYKIALISVLSAYLIITLAAS